MATLKVTNIKNESFAGNQLYLKTDGKIGIGTTSPETLLDVSGSTPILRVTGTSSTPARLDLTSAGAVKWSLLSNDVSSALSIEKDDSAKFVINTSGNVGIGTTSPAHPLHVSGEAIAVDRNAGDPYIYLKTSGSAKAAIYGGAATGFRIWTLPSGGSLTERVRVTNDDTTSFGNASPNAWQTGGGYYNIQLGNAGYLRADTDAGGNFFSNGVNLYRDNSGWKFIEDGRGTQVSHGIGNSAITFYGTNSGNAGGTPSFFEMLRLDVNGDVVCGSGNLVLTDGQGISFAADGNTGGMTSELLDDYEEGTWTPTMTTNGAGTLSATYTTQTGTYTKIGRLVYIMFDMVVSDTPSGNAGYPMITGLPFTPVVGQSSQGGYPIPQFRDSSAMPVDARLYNSSYGHSSNTAIWIQYYNSSGVIQQPAGGTWWAQGRCQGEMVYYAT